MIRGESVEIGGEGGIPERTARGVVECYVFGDFVVLRMVSNFFRSS